MWTRALWPSDKCNTFLHKTVLYKKLGWHLFNVGHLYQHLSRRYWGQMLQTHTLPSCSKIYCLLPQNINYGVPAATKLNLCCLNDLFWALTLAAAHSLAQPGVSQPRQSDQMLQWCHSTRRRWYAVACSMCSTIRLIWEAPLRLSCKWEGLLPYLPIWDVS